MRIRRAQPGDFGAIRDVARASLRAIDPDLMRRSTRDRWLAAAYTTRTLRRRLEDHPIFVSVDEGRVVGFADAFLQDGRIVLSTLFVHPSARRRGAGRALLTRVRGLTPLAPVAGDVVLGNSDGEAFAEALGFAPGETVHTVLFGEPVVERRWWLPPLQDQAVSRVAHGA